MKESSKDQRWVIVFLIYADFLDPDTGEQINHSFLKDLESLCGDLLRCTIDDSKFSVYAVISRVNYDRFDDSIKKFVPTSETFIFQVRYSAGDRNNIVFVEKAKQGIHDEKGIANIFNSINKNETRDQQVSLRWFLNTWDHGSAFGMFTNRNSVESMHDWEFARRSIKYPAIRRFMREVPESRGQKPKRVPRLANDVKKMYYFQGRAFTFKNNEPRDTLETLAPILLFKESGNSKLPLQAFIRFGANISAPVDHEIVIHNEMLENSELSKGISMGINDRVDVLLMMNCWMMNLDTISLMANSTEYLVAPQSGIEKDVYNYPALLDYIFRKTRQSTGLSPGELAKFCIDSIRIYSPDRDNVRDMVEECAVFAFHLSRVPEIKSQIETLINGFIELALDAHQRSEPNDQERLIMFLKLAAIYSFHFDDQQSLFQIDFLHWIKNLRFSTIPNGTLIEDGYLNDIITEIGSPGDICSLLGKLNVTEPHIGTKWASSGSGFVKEYDPSGLSIYLPSKPLDRIQKERIEKYFKEASPGEKRSFYSGNENLKKLINLISC